MDISSISRNAAVSLQGMQRSAETASPEVMQAATAMLMKESAAVAEQAMDALLADMMQSLSHLGQNVDMSV